LSPRVVVVGLGPAGPELVTVATQVAIEQEPHRYIRTTRHPSAALVEPATSFDDVYESAATLDEVYTTIADRVVAAAVEFGSVLYAVPGSPSVAERSVVVLGAHAARGAIELDVLPALSFADLAWARLGVDPLDAGARLIDGHQFAVEAAGERGPLLVAQCDRASVLSDIKLSIDLEGPPVVVLQRLGLPDERVELVPRVDLDRVAPDHLTTLFIAEHAPAVASEVARFDELVHTLREQCPWDREQTHKTLSRHLLEETYEVLDAIEALDPETYANDEHLEEELGDLLFQVCFHATLAGERGSFTLAGVARGVHDKLVLRHPHVFGDVAAEDADTVMRNWEVIKKDEKGRASVFDGIPPTLPALLYAHKILRKADSLGVESGVPDPLPAATEIGPLLLALVAAARALDVDPEAALRAAAVRLKDDAQAREQQE
jgi:tetrapyrrole methylase family protein/MazG family protein